MIDAIQTAFYFFDSPARPGTARRGYGGRAERTRRETAGGTRLSRLRVFGFTREEEA